MQKNKLELSEMINYFRKAALRVGLSCVIFVKGFIYLLNLWEKIKETRKKIKY